MKFIDSLKLAFHNIVNNKSRSILTIIIVFIVSTLILGLTTFGIVFNTNSVGASKEILNIQGTTYYLKGKINSLSDEYYLDLNDIELDKLDELTTKHESIIDKITLDSSFLVRNNDLQFIYPTYIDVNNYDLKKDNLILEGRIWNKDDKNKQNVWLSNEYVEFNKENGVNLNVGDNLDLTLEVKKEPFGREFETIDTTFTIAGIFDKELTKESCDDYGSDILMDYRYFYKTINYDVFYNVHMSYKAPTTDYNFNKVYKEMKTFDKEMKNFYGVNIDNDQERDRFNCSFIEEIQTAKLMGFIAEAVLIILAFIVLLLSIGSVANTVVISVDKNRKFIGLMKALGLNEKGVKRMIDLETFITVLVGIILATILLYVGIAPVLSVVIQKMIDSIYGYMNIKYTVVVNISILIPLVTLLIFFIMTKLFSKGSLSKIASQDVIETISEVA